MNFLKGYLDIFIMVIIFIAISTTSWWLFGGDSRLLAINTLAIIFSPLVALRVEKKIEMQKEMRTRKKIIFRILMAARGKKLSEEHVEALNMIQLDFIENKNVYIKWKEYLEHLNNGNKNNNQTEIRIW